MSIPSTKKKVIESNNRGQNNIFQTKTCNLILFFISLHKNTRMKYSELVKIVKKAGCYDTGRQMAGHPLWHCPKTGKDFKMSNHGSEEVATGTLNSILKAAGLK